MLSAALDRHGEPERETGWRGGGLPGLCFHQCRALRPVVLWSLSQGRGSVERALAGRPSGSASERASSFEILWRWGLWKKRRKGSVSDQSTWGRTRRRSPSVLPAQGQLPLSLSRAGSLGTGVHLEVAWLHPDSQAERQGRYPRPPPRPECKKRQQAERKPNPAPTQRRQEVPPAEDHNTILPRVPTRLGEMPGKGLDGASPRFPSITMPAGGDLASPG